MALAADVKELISGANQAYADEDYELAQARYDSILQMGKESAWLYYNLGNACFKQDKLGKAILYYERAKRLAPNEQRIQHNLQFAQNRQKDEIETLPLMFHVRWWKHTTQLFSLNTWGMITLALALITALLWAGLILTARVSKKKRLFFPALILSFLFLLSLTITVRNKQYQDKEKQAIVLHPVVTAKASPNSHSRDLFIIHEGLKVHLIDGVDGWYEVKLADGSVGWLPEASLETI